MASYSTAERRLRETIATRFALKVIDTPLIRTADEVLLATEARDIMGGQSAGKWTLYAEPLPDVIVPLTHRDAKAAFLSRFRSLTDDGDG